ncbi:hypothetical protein CsSME_00026375 [Camellia sinensis var. sinensis]
MAIPVAYVSMLRKNYITGGGVGVAFCRAVYLIRNLEAVLLPLLVLAFWPSIKRNGETWFLLLTSSRVANPPTLQAPVFNQHLATVSFNRIGSLLHWIQHSITTTQNTQQRHFFIL